VRPQILKSKAQQLPAKKRERKPELLTDELCITEFTEIISKANKNANHETVIPCRYKFENNLKSKQ
jgi:hypothetical protein